VPKRITACSEQLLPVDLEARRPEIEEAVRALAQIASAQWERAEKAERELAVLRVTRDIRNVERARARRVAEGKAPAHRARLIDVACKYAEVEQKAKGTDDKPAMKKGAAVKDVLRMSLPTYRKCLAELRERAADDPELARSLRWLGFE
jgi:hypothetical protein